ncbi:hypothetical protein V8G54_021208 [Vigna mungo]|uniref:Leucine-rich repeat-containing N-terminal plant-type domain-containing protein n=1 Tax=Vigna mungo TaxID=3915 RepID=A0AAQ3RVG4_VIGMU
MAFLKPFSLYISMSLLFFLFFCFCKASTTTTKSLSPSPSTSSDVELLLGKIKASLQGNSDNLVLSSWNSSIPLCQWRVGFFLRPFGTCVTGLFPLGSTVIHYLGLFLSLHCPTQPARICSCLI